MLILEDTNDQFVPIELIYIPNNFAFWPKPKLPHTQVFMIDKIHIPTILLSHQNTSSLTPKFSWKFSESETSSTTITNNWQVPKPEFPHTQIFTRIFWKLNKLYHHNKQLAGSNCFSLHLSIQTHAPPQVSFWGGGGMLDSQTTGCVFHPNGPQRWCHLALLKFQAVWNYATRILLQKKPQEKMIAKKHAFTRDFNKIQFKRKGVGKTPVTEKATSWQKESCQSCSYNLGELLNLLNGLVWIGTLNTRKNFGAWNMCNSTNLIRWKEHITFSL